jgi:hypothetical protein
VLVFVECTDLVAFISNILVALNVVILLPSTYPLWTGRTAVDTPIVLVCLCDFTQFGAGLRVDLPHFTHFDQVAFALSVLGIWKRGVLWTLARERSRWWGEKRMLAWCSVVLCCCTVEGGFLVISLYCHVVCMLLVYWQPLSR